ncbi:hypothetical protein NN561_011461 [Cricetulus griseus]
MDAAHHSDTGSAPELHQKDVWEEPTAREAEQRGTKCHSFCEGGSEAHLTTGARGSGQALDLWLRRKLVTNKSELANGFLTLPKPRMRCKQPLVSSLLPATPPHPPQFLPSPTAED